MDNDSLLVIAGHPRSGTTLLTRMLNAHPDVQLTFEFRCFRSLGIPLATHLAALRQDALRRRIVELGPRRLDRRAARPVRAVSAVADRFASLVFLWRYRAVVKGYPMVTLPVVERALRSYFKTQQIVGDKYPEYVFHLDELLLDQRLNVLVIYRDPRDIAASVLQMFRAGWRGGELGSRLSSAEGVATGWIEAMRATQNHVSQIHTVRYEELVADPRSQIESTAAWLGLDREIAVPSGVHAQSVGTYRSVLSSGEISAVESTAHDMMVNWGYL